MDIGENATHQIVRRGADGDGIAIEVEAVLREEEGDAWKAGVQIFFDVTHVEVDRAVHAFASDGTGDDVARSELQKRMMVLHEALALCVDQPRPFATERFAQQEARAPGSLNAVGWNW